MRVEKENSVLAAIHSSNLRRKSFSPKIGLSCPLKLWAFFSLQRQTNFIPNLYVRMPTKE